MGALLLRAALNARAAEIEDSSKVRLLIVGAGGGQELETFGRTHPDWRFVGVDPSAVMLEQARLRIRGTDVESRTLLVEGELSRLGRQHDRGLSTPDEERQALQDSMELACAVGDSSEPVRTTPVASGSGESGEGNHPSASPPPAEASQAMRFDGAACMLVLHFAQGTDAKKKLLHAIADRLKPGAPLLIASLDADYASPAYPAMMEAWRLHMRAGGISEEEWRRFADSLGPQSDPIPAAAVESLLEECGFVRPQRYFGAFLIDGWFTFRNGGNAK